MRVVSLSGSMMASSLLIGAGSIIGLRVIPRDSYLIAWCMGLLLVCFLPWLVAFRKKFWKRSFPAGGKWLTAVTVLLWLSVIIWPLVTASYWLWSLSTDAPDNMAELGKFVGLALFSLVSFYAAYGVAVIAFLIQLFRNQWRPKLTCYVIGYLYFLSAAFCWIIR